MLYTASLVEEVKVHLSRGGPRRGVSVRPGAVLKARQEAGLSLAQLGKGHVTRAAIHLVEKGQARPSLRTLRVIAERTQRPLAFFLAEEELRAGVRPCGDARLLEVEELFEQRKFSETIVRAGELRLEVTERADHGQLELWMGASHLKLRDQITLALDHLRKAYAIFEEVGDPWLLVDCLGWEAFGLHLKHNPCAQQMAEEALRRARNLDPVPCRTEARILAHLSLIHLDHQRWGEVVKAGEAGLAASEAVADLHTMAIISHNLAVALWELGDQARAFDRARLALSIHQALSDWHLIAASENNLAEMYLRQGNFIDAFHHITAALEHCDAFTLDTKRSDVLRTLTRYHICQGNFDNAETAARQALMASEHANQPLFSARAHQYLGEIAARQDRPGAADAEFEAAIQILIDTGAHERLMECRSAYAELLRERGDKDQAILQLEAAVRTPASILDLSTAAEA